MKPHPSVELSKTRFLLIHGVSSRPPEPGQAWDGEDLCGTWTFTVADPVGADIGFIEQWCLIPGPPDPPDDGGVPSTTGVGVIVMILLLLGSSAYFLRRRATE